MRTLYIGFSKPIHKILPVYSWAIRLLEGTKFSHVYVRHSTKYNIDLIYQASGTQVNFESGELFFQKAETVREFEFDVSDQAFDNYMGFAIRNAGKPYGILQVVGIALCSIFGLKKNPFPNGKSNYVCSELIAEILFEIGKFKYDKNIFDRCTPKDLYIFCVNNEST